MSICRKERCLVLQLAWILGRPALFSPKKPAVRDKLPAQSMMIFKMECSAIGRARIADEGTKEMAIQSNHRGRKHKGKNVCGDPYPSRD
jgi:hypothetical protein